MNQKVAIIFGAGSGIGHAIFDRIVSDEKIDAYGFSRRGMIDSQDLTRSRNHRFDLTVENDWLRFNVAWEKLTEKWAIEKKNVEVIVYFAQGDGLFNSIEELKLSEIERHFNLNLFSIFRLLQSFSANIKIMPFTFIFLSSTAARMGFSNSSAYCAVKHGVSGLAKAIREEWKPYGVKVVNAFLGAIATGIWDNRPEFSKNEMISLTDASEFLASLTHLPHTLFLDEIYLTPKKGVL